MDYTIKNRELTVTLKTLSGTLKSIKDSEGREYIWQPDPAFWTGQAPVCFPICGSIRDNTAEIGSGKTTSMPRHGIVRKREFTMEKQSDDEIVFSITSDQDMLEKYPFPFRLYTMYHLEGKSLRVTYRVENTGTETMPFFIGGHPAFACPLEKGERFEDYHLIFPEKETCAPSAPLSNGLQDMNDRTPLLDNTDDLKLSYRHSVLMENECVVVSALFRLDKGVRADIRAEMDDLMGRRKDKQPVEYPSAGSTFKRPEGQFAGALIQNSGLRGYTVGGAQVSEKHCGFVINRGGASAKDIMQVITDVQKTVFEKTGFMLECEVRIIPAEEESMS